MSQIICLAAEPWGDYASRSRQLISRLKNHRILYFDPRPAGKGQRNAMTASHKDEGQLVEKWTTCYASPPSYSHLPPMFKPLTDRLMVRYIKERMSEVGFTNPVLWLGLPHYEPLVKSIPNELVIFDCPSEPYEYGIAENCARTSDMTICRTREMFDLLKPFCDKTFLVKDGADFARFNTAANEELPFPDALFNIRNPILGLVGKIGSHLELEYIRHAAAEHPEWSFVLIGNKDGTADLSLAEGLRNVHFTGYVEQKHLPAFLQRFDACLYLGKKDGNGPGAGILYEYLSTGKPIVGTPHSLHINEYANVSYIASNPGEFVDQCKKAISERDAWKVRQRVAYGKSSSWDARVIELNRSIQQYVSRASQQSV